ncbi:hypothetical protein [Streptococcus sanguinis]|uniref:hypothetical protein n=1 Tax=Streptococcus sanguinis TaxID=1305 RepID=UPI001CBE14E1|nr:hypothetical protein [Streptococcus sanguinis]MBZ2058368.1 hypothetical protein [Streptococcus sanguinis]
MDKEQVLGKMDLKSIDELKEIIGQGDLEYADVIGESNFFIISKENTRYGKPTISFIDMYEDHRLIELSLDYNDRPKNCKAYLTIKSLAYIRGKYRKKPLNWELVAGGEFCDYFHGGHVLGYSLANQLLKECYIYDKYKKLLFIQTAWSNMNFCGRNRFSQWYFEEKIKRKLENGGAIFYKSELIYKSADDKIPLGIHIQSLSDDGELEINVFIPNIDTLLKIDYREGKIYNMLD